MTRYIGVMSGSSLDGLDIALVAFDSGGWKLEAYKTMPLPDNLVLSLKSIAEHKARELAQTEASYSAFMSRALATFTKDKGAITAIGVHGHTILHLPEIKTSWQLLNGGRLAAELNLPIVCDFRNQDMALGGQGTPMAVIADRDLYPGYDYYFNLGGIANVSYQSEGTWTAYDVCPCNQLLNHYSQKIGQQYDQDGLLAQSGAIDPELISTLNATAYFHQSPPKSLDNSWIREYFIKKAESHELSVADSLRTLTECIVQQLTHIIKEPHSKILMTGGGSKNTFLIQLLTDRLSGMQVDIVIPEADTIDYKEAILIAYCTKLRLERQANFIASATGASANSIGGAVYLPSEINTDV